MRIKNGILTSNEMDSVLAGLSVLSSNFLFWRKIINLLGKEEKQKTNHIQILIFEDGTIEKRIVIE